MPREEICAVEFEWHALEGAELGKSMATPRRPLVVGASGQIGLNLLTLLGNMRGCEAIRVLDVAPPMEEVVRRIHKPVEFIEFRLGTDAPEQLRRHLDSIDCVFSVVTPNVQFASKQCFFSTNIVGVEHLTEACVEQKVPRYVHLSSVAVSNHFVSSTDQDEAHPLPALEKYKSPYDISKRRGESIVLEANGKGVTKTCSLRPCGVMCSTRDYIFSNLWPILPGMIVVPVTPVRIDFIDGRDVARGLVMAAHALEEKPDGVAGEPFWLTKGEALIPGEVARSVARHLGLYFVRLPNWVLHFVALAGWSWHNIKRLVGLELSGVLPHWFIQMAGIEQTFDNSKIQERVGFYPKVRMADSISRISALYRQEISARRA